MQGEFKQALSHYHKLTELVPEAAMGWTNCGDAHSALGENEMAMRDYRRVVELPRTEPFKWAAADLRERPGLRGL